MAEIKTDLNHKYKDRDPLETVEIIKDFFYLYNFIIKEEICIQATSLTWWCHISLFKKDEPNIEYLSTNGKGTTKEFALASGYGELYERFCNGFVKENDTFIYSLVSSKRKKNKGYYIHPQEQWQSFNEVKNCCLKFQEAFIALEDKDDNLLKIHNLLYENNNHFNEVLTIPFINFNDFAKVKYFDPLLVHKFCTSSGCSAGNTLKESLVQGLSECYEHEIVNKIFYDSIKTFYQLNIEKINLPNYLKEIIQEIKKENELYFYDFSFQFNLPVIMVVLINKITHCQHINLGSHPIFNIALERVLTEIYQGVKTFSTLEKKVVNEPFLNNNEQVIEYFQNIDSKKSFPENILLNYEIQNDYNRDIFLSNDNITNEELYNHLKSINIKNNFNVYYLDTSLSNEMYATKIFIENLSIFHYKYKNYCKDLTYNDKQQFFNNMFIIMQNLLNLIRNEEINYIELLEAKNNSSNFYNNNLNVKNLDCLKDTYQSNSNSFIDFDFSFDALSFFQNLIDILPFYFINHKIHNSELNFFLERFLYTVNQNYTQEEINLILNKRGFNDKNLYQIDFDDFITIYKKYILIFIKKYYLENDSIQFFIDLFYDLRTK